MKVLALYEYPPMPGGLATQGDLLFRGLREIGVDVQAVHYEAIQEKEWYFRWYRPDIAVGVGYWGYAPNLILHPQRFGIQPVPWLVADGYVAQYREELDALPLILVTSNWVKQVYIRDGIKGENIEVLPVGCDTETFIPREPSDPRVAAIRESLGVAPDELMILTVGGDAASKGGQEVMRALASLGDRVPKWKYVCKVWPQPRTEAQNCADRQLMLELGIEDKVVYAEGKMSRNYMPYLLAACDIYAGPSRLEGFGMPHVEAGACGKPVLAIKAMAFLDTIVHEETGFLVGVAQENRIYETVLGEGMGEKSGMRITFDPPRVADYRASVADIAEYLYLLMNYPDLRASLGAAGRKRVVELFDYRVVARRMVDLVARKVPGVESPLLTDPAARVEPKMVTMS